jgi:hypothetical protein
MFYEMVALQFLNDDHNLIKKGIPLTGKKVGAMTREIDLAKLKKASKSL